VLGTTSPELDLGGTETSQSAVRASDIKAVGWTSTAPELAAAGLDPANGTLGLGIATYGEWSTLGGAVTPIIDTDIDGDGIWDLESYVWKYSPDLDLTTAETYALEYAPATGYAQGDLLDLYLANGLSGDLDTSVFDSNVTVVPMNLAAVGIEPGDTPTFVVAMYSPYAESPSGVVDETEPFTATPFDPPVWFESVPGATPDTVEDTLWFDDQPDLPIVAHRSPDTTGAQLLVLHAQNDLGVRAQVVDVTVPEPKAASTIRALAPGTVYRGTPVPVSVLIRSNGAPPTGTVTVSEGGRTLSTARVLTIGSTGLAVVVVRNLPVGTHHLTVAYSGNAQVEGSSTDETVRVTQRPRHTPWWW